MINSKGNEEQFCCESMAYLQSSYDIIYDLHGRTLYFGNEGESKFYDTETEIFTLQRLLQDCPFCKKVKEKITIEDIDDAITLRKIHLDTNIKK